MPICVTVTGAAMMLAVAQPALSQSLSERPLACTRGNAAAKALLGFNYANGRGVPQNYVIAAHLYTCAAEQGNATAQFLLGLLYDRGQGVARDAVLAHTWLNLATANARPRERDYYVRIRDAVATKMSAAELAEAQFLAYLRRPGPQASGFTTTATIGVHNRTWARRHRFERITLPSQLPPNESVSMRYRLE